MERICGVAECLPKGSNPVTHYVSLRERVSFVTLGASAFKAARGELAFANFERTWPEVETDNFLSLSFA